MPMIDSQGSVIRRILVLGGTAEASALARALARAGAPAVFSYAGRTSAPVAQPLPTRVGGFGGVSGLRDWLRQADISHVIDATHPFAAQISRHAVQACAEAKVHLLALQRPAWQPQPGDRWHRVPDIEAAVAALPTTPQRIFAAIGRQQAGTFLRLQQHWWLLRVVEPGLSLPPERGLVVVERGPYEVQKDLMLLQTHRIDCIVAKNSGGSGGAAKLEAARRLGCPVIMIERPTIPHRPVVESVADVLLWLGLPTYHAA